MEIEYIGVLEHYSMELIRILTYQHLLKILMEIFFKMSKIITDEKEYINLIEEVLRCGSTEVGRNGKTIEIFGKMMRFSLEDNKLPLLTTKFVSWKTVLKELLWFINGKSNNKYLTDQKVYIWNGNSTREFLDSVGLSDYPEGILGPIYGVNWRNFNGKYDICHCEDLLTCNCNSLTKEGRCDQLQNIIDQLKDPVKRYSRRLIMTAWNPLQINQMALPPCHIMCQFRVTDGNKLSCLLTQRSGDIGLGVPYNIASYAFLTNLIAFHCDLVPKDLIISLGSAHIYEQHIDGLIEQVKRDLYDQPLIKIGNKREKIEDYIVEDFEVIGYVSHPPIKLEFVA